MSKSYTFASIAEQIGQRPITHDEAVWLINQQDLPALGALAEIAKQQHHPDRKVGYVVGRIINTTNVCQCRCKFCQYSRRATDADAFCLQPLEVLAKVQQLADLGGNEVLIQGGLNVNAGLSYYEAIFSSIRRYYPQVVIHALSPTELVFFSRREKMTPREVILRLKDAGLQSVPGAGAEILVDEVRRKISKNKITADEWIDTMREVHKAGLGSSATMMYGHVETLEDRITHLERIRELQQETDGFRAFILWPFQPMGTQLSDINPTGAAEYLKMAAVARIVLHNVPNIQVSILTQGPRVAQVSLSYGVNDFGSTMLEENVVSVKSSRYIPAITEMKQLIHQAGYTAYKRNTFYETVA